MHPTCSLTTWNEYLFAGGGMVGVHFTATAPPPQPFLYFVKDHLGSIAVITNGAGVVHERLAYDAWGKRRNPDGTDDAAGILTASTTRGFTGHEMIDEIDLVNMNGRVYDPALGRFMSADPFIHDVTNSQDLNRYSYVHNNPLSYTDQNGYGFFKSLGHFFKKLLKPLLAIVVAIAIIHFGPLAFGFDAGTSLIGGGLSFAEGAVISGVSGGISNVVLTGKIKSFLTGFGQGFATFGVGHGLFKGVDTGFGKAGYFGKSVAHGVVGGAFSEIRGGSFKSGFLAAGFSSAVAPLAPSGSVWAGAAFSAAAGGVGSVFGGGKFADGAVTAAFTYLFNAAATREGGLRCEEKDPKGCGLLRAQLKNPASIARQVNRDAITNGMTIMVYGDAAQSEFIPGRALSSILLADDNGFVPGAPGSTPRQFTVDEVFEHELSHALDWVRGVPYNSGDGIIEVSGFRVLYAPAGAGGEARAINRTNVYLASPSQGLSLRYSYEDPNFPPHSVK